MIQVSNRGCIRRLSIRSLSAAKSRNIIAVIAIALTTILFTSLFTIALALNEAIQMSNFRQAGARPMLPLKAFPRNKRLSFPSIPALRNTECGCFSVCPRRSRPFSRPMWR